MLRVCQSIRTSSLPDKENQAIFAARSPTAIRNIRPLSLRPKQIPETSRSGTWTTRRTRSRFLLDLRFLPSERVSAGMKGTLQPLPDDFLGFCSTKDRFPSVDATFQSRENVGIVAARGRTLSSVRPWMRQEHSRRPVWEFADRVQITRSVLEARIALAK